MNDRISVFGLGKLGSAMLACFAHKGWQVIGVDIDEEVVRKVNQGESPVYEPGVGPLIRDNKARIKATLDCSYAIMETDISFIIVPTPSLANGSFTTQHVEAVVAEIGSVLRSKDRYHTVVVTSTVLPGDMMFIRELLERTSGKACGNTFGLCYNPDFIALGSIVRDFLNPDMVLIGESDRQAGDRLEKIHLKLVDGAPEVHRMNFYNAELTKIALNSYCTLKITFANTLAEFCENIPGGDADVVTAALGADSRIGHKYLKGGLSYGGPCFPRDNRAISHSARKFGSRTPLAEMTDTLNDYHRHQRLPEKLLGMLKQKNTNRLSVLGVTYKKDTSEVEESAALSIIRVLGKKGVKIKVYDPAGMANARRELAGFDADISYAENANRCLQGALVVFIASPWDEFGNLSRDDFTGNCGKDPIIFDAWNLCPLSGVPGLTYVKIGKAVRF